MLSVPTEADLVRVRAAAAKELGLPPERLKLTVLGVPGRPRREVTPEEESEARKLLAEGVAVREIARRLELPYSTLRECFARWSKPTEIVVEVESEKLMTSTSSCEKFQPPPSRRLR